MRTDRIYIARDGKSGMHVLATLQPDGALRAGCIDILESREIRFT